MQKPDWDQIDTVLLDMDGTLIDKHREDEFWKEVVPGAYAKKNKITLEEAKEYTVKKFRAIKGSYDWSNIDYWSRELGMSLWPLRKQSVSKMKLHPHTLRFLKFLKKHNKKIYLITASMHRDINMKIRQTKMKPYFDGIYSQFDIRKAKKDPDFWRKLQKLIGFDPKRTLLGEDMEMMAKAAQKAGIKWIVYKSLYNSKKPAVIPKGLFCVHHFDEVISGQ